MFSTSPVTVHSPFTPLYIGPNDSTISSSHRREGLPGGRFHTLEYQSIVAHRSACCLWTLWRVRPSETSAFCTLRSRPSFRLGITLLCMIFSVWIFRWPCLCSFFVVAHVLQAYNITDKTLLLKKLASRVLSRFGLSTFFTVINVFPPYLILIKEGKINLLKNGSRKSRNFQFEFQAFIHRF